MANHRVVKFLTSVFKHVCVIDNPNMYCDRCFCGHGTLTMHVCGLLRGCLTNIPGISVRTFAEKHKLLLSCTVHEYIFYMCT